MRRILLSTITILFLLTSCQTTPTTIPREPVPLTEVERAAEAFEALTRAEGEAWNSRNNQALRAVFTEDATFTDQTFGDHAVGIDAIEALMASVAMFFSSWEGKITDRYIGLEGGITVNNMWNLELGGYKFTQDDPMVEVDWLQTREDHIASMTLLYDLDTLKRSGRATQGRLDQVGSLLSSYQLAWSSGDRQAVEALYSSDAVRVDTIFGERLEGRDAIASFAESFFTWYPGMQWSLSLGFGEGRGDEPMTGGLYFIKMKDLWASCKVKVAVLLQTTGDQIVHETLYYESQSLIKCGWVR